MTLFSSDAFLKLKTFDVEWVPSPNKSSRDAFRPELIILHSTVGKFAGAVNWLRNGRRTHRTSAHYVISRQGQIVQLVREDEASWHAGYGIWKGKKNINQRSIGIELENRNNGHENYPIVQLEAALSLCYSACRVHLISPEDIIGHNHVDPDRKTDPRLFPWTWFRCSIEKCLNAE